MTARRGSLRFRVTRLARAPLRTDDRFVKWKRIAATALIITGRCLAVVAAVLVATTIATQVWRVAKESHRLDQQILVAEKKNGTLKTQSVDLAKEIKSLHNVEYLVPLIHEQLGLGKRHEVFISVQTPAPQPLAK